MKVGKENVKLGQILRALRNSGAPTIGSPYDTADMFLAIKGAVPATTRKGRLLQAMQLATGLSYNKVAVVPGGPRAPNRKPRQPRKTNPDPSPILSAGPSTIKKKEFYQSWEWRTLRMEVLKTHGSVCQCCGSRPGETDVGGLPVRIVVDHIKPLSKFWNLRLDKSNLQVLCDECNQGKGAWDETDYRPKPHSKPQTI